MAMAMAIEISRLRQDDQFHVTFNNQYNIYTTVTDDPAAVSHWISRTISLHRLRLDHLVVGLDVEWPWPPLNNNHPRVAILQLCVGTRCLIFKLAHHSPATIPNSLIGFLSNRNYTFVGVNIHNDLIKLHRDYGVGNTTAAVDLRHLAARKCNRERLRNARLKHLTRFVMNEDYTKPPWVIRSRWDDQRLTDDQIKYASVDAFIHFEIGMRLKAYQRPRFELD